MRTGSRAFERRLRPRRSARCRAPCRGRDPAARNGRSRPPASPAADTADATGRCPLPSSDRSPGTMSSRSTRPTISSKVRKPSCRHQLAHFLGDEEEIVDDVLGLAGEALAQHRVLRRDADRAGVQMALAHHDAAGGDQRRRREAELVGAEQRTDDDVAAGPQARHRPAPRCGRANRCAPASAASRRGRSPMASRHGSARSAGWRRCRLRSRRSSHGRRAPSRRRPRPCRPRLRIPASPIRRPAGWRFSDRGSAAPDPRSNRCRGAAAARSARPPASNSAPWRSSCRPCGRAVGRLRRAWRPAPS